MRVPINNGNQTAVDGVLFRALTLF